MGMKGSNNIFQNSDDKHTAEVQVMCFSAVNAENNWYFPWMPPASSRSLHKQGLVLFLRYQLFIERAALMYKLDVSFHRTESAK